MGAKKQPEGMINFQVLSTSSIIQDFSVTFVHYINLKLKLGHFQKRFSVFMTALNLFRKCEIIFESSGVYSRHH